MCVGLVDAGDRWIIPAEASTVMEYRLSMEFTILIDTPRGVLWVSLSAPFVFRSHGIDELIDPGTDPARLGGVLALIRQHPRRVEALKTGVLEMEFQDGSLILAEHASGYEAWQVSGSRGLLVVADPGGGLTVWSPSDS